VEKLVDWNMVVDEIYYEVKHMEPWTAGECVSHLQFISVQLIDDISHIFLLYLFYCR
jgi:hypothetical protein